VSSNRVPRFNFFWYEDHSEYKPELYECKYAQLSSVDRAAHDKIQRFVGFFMSVEVLDGGGKRQ